MTRPSVLDVKLGLRMLVKHPALTLVGGFGIAVAVAMSVGFFSFMRAYLYPVVPLPEGHRIVALENRDVEVNDEERRSLHDFFTWRSELRTIEDVSAFRRVVRNATTGDSPHEGVQIVEMTARGFSVAGIAPLLGRHLLEEDEADGAANVVVIGYGVWQHRFGGDPRVVGREIRFSGVPHAIVGVMPEGFAFPENDAYWTPLRAKPASYERRAGPAIYIFGRLAPGVSMKQAQAELTVAGQQAAAAHPQSNAALRPMVMPYTHSLTDVQGISFWEVAQMQLMMTLLLLVVALNVAVLVYARTAARRREIAVRSALGASRSRVVVQLFVEALMLALVSAAAGLALARFGIRLADGIMAAEMDAGTPFWLNYDLRLETVLLTVGLAVLIAVIVGVIPGLQATRERQQQDLRMLGAAAGSGLGRTWTLLVVAQVAVAVAALPTAIALAWTEIERGASRPAFADGEFVAAGLSLDPELVPDGRESGRFARQLDEVIRRLRAEPAVLGVSYQGWLPDRSERVRVDGVAAPAESPAGHYVATAGFAHDALELFGLRMLAGRSFTAGDGGEGSTAVIVNDAFVQQVLGGGDALGRRLRHVAADEEAGGIEPAAPRWFEIVGVVQNMMQNPTNPDLVRPAVMYPLAPHQLASATIIMHMRSGVTATDLAPTVRSHVAAVDPTLRFGTVRSMADGNSQQAFAMRLIALSVALVLASVLLLTAAGIYALISFTVTQRRREIGVRSALGAPPRQVLLAVFARAARQIGTGVAIGVTVALLLDWQAGGSMLRGRSAAILPALVLAVLLVGVLAALGPARRGMAIQPTEALRADS